MKDDSGQLNRGVRTFATMAYQRKHLTFIRQTRLLQGAVQYVLSCRGIARMLQSQQSGRSKICASTQASCMALGTIPLMCPRGMPSGHPLHLRRQ